MVKIDQWDAYMPFRLVRRVCRAAMSEPVRLRKLLLVMRLTSILLMLAVIQVTAATSEAQKISFQKKDATLLEVLQSIGQQTGYFYVYDAALLQNASKVNVSAKNADIRDVLTAVFKDQPLTYAIDGKTIVVREKVQKTPGPKEETLVRDPEYSKSLPPVSPLHHERLMERINLATVVDRTVRGRVTDEKSEPLPGVNILLKGTQRGTVTDAEGRFTIDVSDNQAVLVFSFVGYVNEEVVVGNRNEIDLSMQVDEKSLDELVVVGYGTQKKRDLTGAISSVKASELVTVATPDVGRALKGKLAGLMVRENSAQPGGGLDILIRGAGSVNASNAPLIVVDGFPISDLQQPNSGGRYSAGTHSILNSFNPNDIESIEVLKDASATAIYGARAANGVVLITTKQGKEGKPQVQYSVNLSSQKYKDSYDLLTGEERLRARNEGHYESWLFNNRVQPFGDRTLAEAEISPVGGIAYHPLYTQNEIDGIGKDTDWFSLITRTGSIQQHNLTVSGGSKTTKYMLSGNYYSHKGIIKNSRLKRYSLRTNIDQEINRFARVGLNLTASQIYNDNSQIAGEGSENSGIIRSAVQMSRHIRAIDEFGNYPRDPLNPLLPNPFSLLTISDRGRVERVLLNAYSEITPMQNLVFHLKAGIDRGATKRWNYLPRTTLHGEAARGRASIAGSDQNSYLFEGTGNYNFEPLAGHSVNVLLGASSQRFENSGESMDNTIFLTDEFLWYNIGSGAGARTVGSSGNQSGFVSYFGRVNYNYKSRYLLTFTLRTDGASVFARNNKWGTFPSVAIGWNVADEDFFSNLRTNISQLKVRVSYGQTGNAAIGSNAFAAYRSTTSWLNGNDQLETGVLLQRLENPNLKWETTTETNVGLDMSLFNGRIDASLEYYNRVISDLLNNHSLNSYHIINNITANIGATQSRGIEVTLNTVNVQQKNFQWRSTFVASRFHDRWKERAADWKPAVYQNDTDPIRPMYYRLADGIMQLNETAPASQPNLQPGMIKIKDVDGFLRAEDGSLVVTDNGRFIRTGEPDGIIDDADYKMLGTSDPGLILGLSNTFRYKKISMLVDFNGMFGRKLPDIASTSYGLGATGSLRTVLERWTPQNPSTRYPGSNMGRSIFGVGDFFLQDAWFVRLQNVSLSYDISTGALREYIKGIQVNATVNNLFVITPYTGIDPETDAYVTPYPNVRTFSLGINLSL